jgi:3',5'-cyclic AMP phosphodiesterase CpdA
MDQWKYILFACLLFAACDKFEYSPNQRFDFASPSNSNRRNIERLLRASGDDTIRFAVTGDTQRAYDNAADFIGLANKIQGLDFVVLDGDISDFGLLAEMKEVDKLYSRLNVPYIALIGNHDLSGNGEHTYRSLFGESDFSFVYKQVKFICQNTNSREYHFNGRVPDIPWISSELQTSDSVSYFVGFGHVPPTSGDFDPALKEPYLNLLLRNPDVLATFFAHTGKTETLYPFDDAGAPLYTTGGIDNRNYSIVTIIHGAISVTHFDF